jgi:hypothetical protein
VVHQLQARPPHHPLRDGVGHNALWKRSGGSALRPVYRVARFFSVQHTKTGKWYQLTTKYTKSP